MALVSMQVAATGLNRIGIDISAIEPQRMNRGRFKIGRVWAWSGGLVWEWVWGLHFAFWGFWFRVLVVNKVSC